jgi:hypothetical protein
MKLPLILEVNKMKDGGKTKEQLINENDNRISNL